MHAKVREFAQDTPRVVSQYLQDCRPGLVTIKPINRTSEKDRKHMVLGSDVELHHAVNGHKPLRIGVS